jgi:Undecaprenyl-phosphate glucose phosphotransferase
MLCLLLTIGQVICDFVAINGSFHTVYIGNIEELQESGFLVPVSFQQIALVVLLLNITFAMAFIASGLYNLRRGSSRVDEAYKVFTAISLATVLSLVINTIMPWTGYDIIPINPQIVAMIWITSIVVTIGLRFIYRKFIYWLRANGIDIRRIVIVGARRPGRAVWHTIRQSPELGYRVQGFLSDAHPVGAVVDDLPVLGRPSQLSRVVRATHADEVLVALSNRSPHNLIQLVTLAENESVTIKVYPDTFQLITNNEISIGDLHGLPLISVKNAALDKPINKALKRGLDLVVSSIILVFTSPMMLLLALIIKLDSPGPVFFLQDRVGLDGKPFAMIKFRTMRTDSESRGPGWTTPGDPRVTRIGHYLRRYSIDELPQFINVLLGEMSIVGPRPEQPKWVERFRQEIPRYMRRHKEKAGITGWAQINGLRGDTSIEERTRYDLYYIENWSLLFDIKIMLRTAADILVGKQENAY